MSAKKYPLVLFWIILLMGSSLGCMYGPPFATVCEKYARADAVIVGKVTRVEVGGLGQRVWLDVVKSYKGKTTRKIILDQPLSTCDWDFSDEVSTINLLYLTKNKGGKTFHAIGAGFGGRLDNEIDDVLWLDNLPRSLRRTRISGAFRLYKDSPFKFIRSLSSVSVIVRGPRKTYNLKTDRNGFFQIWDIASGSYGIEPNIASDLELIFASSKGDIDFKRISDVQVDTNIFKILIGKEKCGGSDYAFRSKDE